MPLRWLGHPEMDKPSNRFNDGKCDTAGRFWVNTMDYNFRPGAGSLYRFEQERGFIIQDSGLSVPNGMGWSPDGRSMYLVDTAERVVYAYDYDDASGNIANRRKFLRVPEDVPGAPDGLTVDRNGNLWIAFFDGWRVGQYGPTGDHLRDIVLPVPRPTSCVIGGPDAATLFITSARIRLGRNLLDTAPFSGGLLAFGKL
jgi:sugar lactone lactonase YvrE